MMTKLAERPKHCPTCGGRITPPTPPARICAKCKVPIDRHHKYRLVMVKQNPPQFEFHHRHCDDPEAYIPKGKRK
jgi:predicted amidophosphoribosyltransferase